MSIQMYDSNSLVRLLGNVCYYALSLAYLKRLNQKVVLYTDTLGKALLGHLPYDEIHLLDVPEEIHPRYFAASKMYALDLEPVDSIHIDGDVFIKTEELLNSIKTANYDVIVQSYERADWYESNAPMYLKDKDFCDGFGLKIGKWGGYNTGLIGFKNKELKDKFIRSYKSIALHFSSFFKKELDSGDYLTPDLIAEQKLIYQLANDSKSKICMIFELGDPKKIGYQHVLTTQKFKPDILEHCMQILKQVSPEIYNNTYKLCQNILNKQK